MCAAVIDMKPNRTLLNPNFDGYKLSLQNIPLAKKDLTNPIDRILLDNSQCSLLHVKLFGLQNHLVGETVEDNVSVYFVDNDWNLCKTYVDVFRFDLVEPLTLWQIPRPRNRLSGDYNVTFRFVNESICILTDGIGTLHILNTGSRNDDDMFTPLYSGTVTDIEKGFLIEDAVLKSRENTEELHIAIKHLKQVNNTEKYVSIINWITLTKIDDKWGQTALRELQSKGDVQYVNFDKKCENLFVISEYGAKITINSEHPVQKEPESIMKLYSWSQTVEDITIKLELPEGFSQNNIHVTVNNRDINVKYEDKVYLNGNLEEEVDKDLTTWSIENNNVLEVVLTKVNTGNMWNTVVVGDNNGDHILESCIVEDVNARLAHLTSSAEANHLTGATFNSQQIEDCDLEYDKTVHFERICGKTNKTVSKVNLGSNPVILTVKIDDKEPPAFGTRHDVDVLMWQPMELENEFTLKHIGTLDAFGYVQASKQQRKFTVCSPDLNNIVLCQATRFLFLYKQKISVTSGELRNRTSGRHIQTVAQQYVINIPNEEILGIHISNKLLFLLGEKSVSVYNIE